MQTIPLTSLNQFFVNFRADRNLILMSVANVLIPDETQKD
jgi:hypothetical protein